MASVLQHPATAATAVQPRLNARVLFGWARTPLRPRVDLWPLTVNDTEYLTDAVVMVRRDALVNVSEDWAKLTHRGIDYRPQNALAKALKADLSPRPTTARFDPRRIAGLYLCGAGVLPLLDDHVLDVHAVVVGNERVGLAAPFRAALAESALGVVPGVPPWPGAVDDEWELEEDEY